MRLRFTRSADATIARVLRDTAQEHGEAAAARCRALLEAAILRILDTPDGPGTIAVETLPGVRRLPLRVVRLRAGAAGRVGRPRHLLLYRVEGDGVLAVLGLVHDQMELARAARRLSRG